MMTIKATKKPAGIYQRFLKKGRRRGRGRTDRFEICPYGFEKIFFVGHHSGI